MPCNPVVYYNKKTGVFPKFDENPENLQDNTNYETLDFSNISIISNGFRSNMLKKGLNYFSPFYIQEILENCAM